MQLKKLKYIKFENKPAEWVIEGCDGDVIRFGNFNLIVGKNAVGKSSTLGVIREIAELLSLKKELAELPFKDNSYHFIFDEKEVECEYILKVKDRKIVDEKYYIGGELKLDRIQNQIYSEQKGDFVDFTESPDIISTRNRNDTEFSFLYPLFSWGNNLYKVNFTNQIEKKKIYKSSDYLDTHIIPKDLHNMLNLAKQMYGKNFDEQLIKDMRLLEYDLASIDIKQTPKGYEIVVHENDLDKDTSQTEMSQGMYRALAFLIFLNYALFSEEFVCVLIDDLGEGLDFDRSKVLTRLVNEKIENSNIQIFITTNDRYIMNIVPIEYWSVVERKAHKSVFYNYFNSRQNFDDYKYTGLSNVDFLATGFYVKGFEED